MPPGKTVCLQQKGKKKLHNAQSIKPKLYYKTKKLTLGNNGLTLF